MNINQPIFSEHNMNAKCRDYPPDDAPIGTVMPERAKADLDARAARLSQMTQEQFEAVARETFRTHKAQHRRAGEHAD